MEVQFNKNSADASIITGPITIIGKLNEMNCMRRRDSNFEFNLVCLRYGVGIPSVWLHHQQIQAGTQKAVPLECDCWFWLYDWPSQLHIPQL